VTVFRL